MSKRPAAGATKDSNVKKHPRYGQTYLREWESDRSLQPWLTKSSKGSAWAFCKFCNCDLKIEKGIIIYVTNYYSFGIYKKVVKKI